VKLTGARAEGGRGSGRRKRRKYNIACLTARWEWGNVFSTNIKALRAIFGGNNYSIDINALRAIEQ